MEEHLLRGSVNIPRILGAIAGDARDALVGRQLPIERQTHFLDWAEEDWDAAWPSEFKASTLLTGSPGAAGGTALACSSLPIATPACAWLRIRTVPFRVVEREWWNPTMGYGWQNLNVQDTIHLTVADTGKSLSCDLGATQEIVLAGGVPPLLLDYTKRTWYVAYVDDIEGFRRFRWTRTKLEITVGYSALPITEPRPPIGLVYEVECKLRRGTDSDDTTFPYYNGTGGTGAIMRFPMYMPLRRYGASTPGLKDGRPDGCYVHLWSSLATYADVNYGAVLGANGKHVNVNWKNADGITSPQPQRIAPFMVADQFVDFSPYLAAGGDGWWVPWYETPSQWVGTVVNYCHLSLLE